MADLTANNGRAFQGEVRRSNYDVAANLEVFEGQAMIRDSGGIVNATPGAASEFVGFALNYVNNLTNSVPHGGAARAVKVEVAIAGLVDLPVTNTGSWDAGDIGLSVYASDGDTFTTDPGTNNVLIGKVVNCDDADGVAGLANVLVSFESVGMRSV